MAKSESGMLRLELAAYNRWKDREMRGEWDSWNGEPAMTEMNNLVNDLMKVTGLERGQATFRLGDLKELARTNGREEASALGLNGTTAASIRNTTLPTNGATSSATLANSNRNGANANDAGRTRSPSR